MIGGEPGRLPAPSQRLALRAPGHIERMLQAAEGYPINLGFLGKGNASRPEPLREQIQAAQSVSSFMRTGTTPATIDCSLTVGEETDTPGRAPYRYPERIRFRRRFHRSI